jgi:uncharacterized protein
LLDIKEELMKRRDFFKTTVKRSIGTMLGLSVLSNFSCKKDSSGMPKRILGRTNLQVSSMGFGCIQVKDKEVYTRAVELGINYFHLGDRDPAYNLDACSALLPHRKKLIIAYMSHPKASRALLLEDLDSFLSQSKLGHLDVWFVITPSVEVLNEFSEAVNIAKKAGKIRFGAMTTHNINQDYANLTTSESAIDVVMLVHNYLSPVDMTDTIEGLHNAGLGIIPMKPLAGKFFENDLKTPASMLRWLAADHRMHTIPVNMTSIAQVEQNVASIRTTLSREDQDLLQSMFSYNSSRFCRMCGYCKGKCPEKLAVSDLIRTSMYMEGYSDIRLARVNLSSIPEENRQISCDNCNQCSISCPNGVAIRKRISVAKKLLV